MFKQKVKIVLPILFQIFLFQVWTGRLCGKLLEWYVYITLSDIVLKYQKKRVFRHLLKCYFVDPHHQDLYRNYSDFLAVLNNDTHNPHSTGQYNAVTLRSFKESKPNKKKCFSVITILWEGIAFGGVIYMCVSLSF